MNFENITGQTLAIERIKLLVERYRFPQVVLFYGPPGVGKQLTAISIAKTLNCIKNNPPECFYCNSCDQCMKIEKGMHPDIHILQKEGDSIKIENVRALINSLNQVAFEGKKKVAIIDDAEALTIQSANALLKTLEEPPADTHIFLITANPGGLPLTLRSRCYPIKFNPLSEEKIVELLRKEITDYPDDTLKTVAGISDGSMESALLFLEMDILKERRNFLQIFEKNYYNIKDIKLFSEDKIDNTDLIKKILQLIRWLILDMIYCKLMNYDRIKNKDLIEEIKRISHGLRRDYLWQLFKKVEQFESLLDWNVNLKIQQSNLLIEILNMEFHK